MEHNVDGFGCRELAAIGLNELDVGDLVMGGDLAGHVDEVGVLDGIDLGGARSARHECQKPGAGAEIEHHVTAPDVTTDALVVGADADAVIQHLLVLGKSREVRLVGEVVDGPHEPRAGGELRCPKAES